MNILLQAQSESSGFDNLILLLIIILSVYFYRKRKLSNKNKFTQSKYPYNSSYAEKANYDVPERSFLGKIIKLTFIGFNVIMPIWLIGGIGSASSEIDKYGSNAAQAGAVIGTGIGALFIIFIWMAGSIILGILTLLTKAK